MPIAKKKMYDHYNAKNNLFIFTNFIWISFSFQNLNTTSYFEVVKMEII